MRFGCVVVALLSGGCGVEHLPPPQSPPRHADARATVPWSAPGPGTGRLVLEADVDRAEVAGVRATDDPTVVEVRALCTTPCVIDLPYGPQTLIFRSTSDPGRESEAAVEVGPRPKVLRHSLGERREGGAAHTTGVALLVFGAIAATTGVILWSASAAGPDDGRGPIATVGQTATVGGATGALLGIPLLFADRPVERPGATTEWLLPSRYDEEAGARPETPDTRH